MSLGLLRHAILSSQACASRAAMLGALIAVAAGCTNGSPFSLAGSGSLCTADAQCASGFCQGGTCGDSAGNPLGGQVCAVDADCRGLLCDPSARRCVACGQGGRAACPAAPDGGVAFFDVSSPPPGGDAGRLDASGLRDRQNRDGGEARDSSVVTDLSISTTDVGVSDGIFPSDLAVPLDAVAIGDVAVMCGNCSANETCCNGQCVDLASNLLNCGTCNNACTDSCVAGFCCAPSSGGQGLGCCAQVPGTTDSLPCCFADPTTTTDVCVIAGLGQQCTITSPGKVSCAVDCGGTGMNSCALPNGCCLQQCVAVTTNQNCGACGCTCPDPTTCHQGRCFDATTMMSVACIATP